MSLANILAWFSNCRDALQALVRGGRVPALTLTIALASVVGLAAGFGSVIFTELIHAVSHWSVEPVVGLMQTRSSARWLLVLVPAIGLLAVAWFTRRFAPEAQGHGVPEVIVAVARNDGKIRPRVSLIKILASGLCIGTGGSIGREGPIVQIGSALGSMAGQACALPPRTVKVLVAAGAAAGISATFNAPLAGVIFASEIILGSFAVESLTPIVIASVIADVVQTKVGEHGLNPAFRGIDYAYLGQWSHLPAYFMLGLICGLAAVGFTKLLYFSEDVLHKWLPRWWIRALVCGGAVGLLGAVYPILPPVISPQSQHSTEAGHLAQPPLFGVGYGVVDHSLHLERTLPESEKLSEAAAAGLTPELVESDNHADQAHANPRVRLTSDQMLVTLTWLLPLVFLKPLLTSMTLAGGGSGGIFAPSLFLGATVGACFGLICSVVFGIAVNPGVFAIVGMGAVVAGTTHGVLSAILIVYEMTDDYNIILPIMAASCLASIVARMIDPESIYQKKLSRRGENIARGHDMHRLEHIMVRDVMIREFPRVLHTDTVKEIVRVAREDSFIESLPVMDDDGLLVGIIRPEDLHRVLDSDMPPHLVNADDIALKSPIVVSPHENLLEAVSDFGTLDVDTLPVEVGKGKSRELVGLLLRADVIRRYREEMLRD